MTKGVIATPHRLASEAGAQVLRDGGNAVDAAIAADAVLCVVYPHMTSVGGDLMAIVWPANALSPVGIVGAGRSGELATIEAVRGRGYETMPERGVLSVTVPGTVEAWGRLLERFGTLGMAAVLEPATSLAANGYLITEQLSAFLKEAAELLGKEPAAHALYPPMEGGMLLRNPDLASVLRDIGRGGIASFYRGEIAEAIAGAIHRRDGLVTARDLATHRSQWVEPLSVKYRDLTIFELPPPTQGLTALAMLARLDRLAPERLEPGVAFVEAFKAIRDECYPLRDRYITDPEFAVAPLEPFLDPGPAVVGTTDALGGGDTTYMCAADEHGNLVSLIQSVAFGFGSGVVAEGTGMLLQNRGAYFKLDPAHVNRLEPKKRTMHTLIPALAARDGRPAIAFGSMGGEAQPQLQLQVLINLVDRGLEPSEAVARPRFRMQAEGGAVSVEADDPNVRQLARSGLKIELMPPGHHTLGHAHAIVVDERRAWRAGADPRSDGSVEWAT
ncbi:MAG TPA: gamma-glutamyltransferase family protein [Candidatus Dormibacteraeota bacterium]|nr:gamma-glutamyltransferase family protein [Candidatus Dormibacteraeota bacterium]